MDAWVAPLRVAAALAGIAGVLVTLRSAIRTFVLPRSAHDPIARAVYVGARHVFEWSAERAGTYHARDHVMALYAPVAILLMVGVWVALVAAAFTLLFWAEGVPWWHALVLSGSSLLTLGYETPERALPVLTSFVEASIGLTLVALLVSYLPAMYAAFSRREAAVTMLEVRAGAPPSGVELLVRAHELGGMDEFDRYLETWVRWFVELEESHTSLAVLTYFRSPQPHRSWVTAAGAVLDAAALASAVRGTGPSPTERVTLRAGTFALRRISEFFRFDFDEHPPPGGPVTVDRAEFDAACARLSDAGLEIRAGEQAWADFVAARVQYDEVLLALAARTMAPYAPWSSDRSHHRPRRSARPRVAPRVAEPTALDPPDAR